MTEPVPVARVQQGSQEVEPVPVARAQQTNAQVPNLAEIMRASYSEPPQPAPNPNDSSNWGAAQNFVSGAVPVVDEVSAAGWAVGDQMGQLVGVGEDSDRSWGESYDQGLNQIRESADAWRDQNPVTDTATNLSGAIYTGGLGARFIANAPSVGRGLARSAGVGAGLGGPYGFLEGEGGPGSRLENAGIGAGIGLVAGPALDTVARGAGNFMARRNFARQAPSADELRQTSGALYQQAEDAGLSVRGDAILRLRDELTTTLRNSGMDEKLDPTLARAIEIIGERGVDTLDLTQIQNLRRIVGRAANSNDQNERRLASEAIEIFDDFMENLNVNDIAAGNAEEAVSLLAQARDAYGRFRRTAVIEEAIERAHNQASGFENGLRVQFRRLLNNERAMRGFSADERRVMEEVAQGGSIRNVLRFFGKFGVAGDTNSNSLIPLLGGMGGFSIDPILGAVVPLAGSGARAGARSATDNAANYARSVVASGMPPPRTNAQSFVDALNFGGLLSVLPEQEQPLGLLSQ